jgi:hypothetical protein
VTPCSEKKNFLIRFPLCLLEALAYSMKKFGVCVFQFYPFNGPALSHISLLLIKEIIKFLFKNFSKVPFSKC